MIKLSLERINAKSPYESPLGSAAWLVQEHACMIGRVVKEVGVANVSDFDQRSKISAETSRDGPADCFLRSHR